MTIETAGDRLRKAREAKGLKQAEVARLAGVKPSTYSAHESGANQYSADQAKIYAKKLDSDPVYLVFGDEFASPHEPQRIPLEEWDPANPGYGESPPATIGTATGGRGIPPGSSAQIDVTAGMGAGGFSIVEEGVRSKSGMTFAADVVSDYWRLPQALLSALGVNASEIVILPVRGDSMSPTIEDGDFVVVHTRHRWPSPDGIYAIIDGYGGIVVKRLELIEPPGEESGRIRIISDNPRHSTREASTDEVGIAGLVLMQISRIR